VMGYKWWEKHRDLVSRRLRRGPETGDDFDEP
jgi:hypothetical protein